MDNLSEAGRPLLERPLIRGAIAAALLALLFGGLFLAQAFQDDGDRDDVETASRGALDDRAPIRGEPAPDFELRTIDGELLTLSDLRGSIVWVNFWATWCRPCKRELPDIQALYEEKQSAGLEVLAVNYDESSEVAAAYFDDVGLELPMVLDHEGDVYDQYRLQGLPDSFFIDRDGNIAAIQYGFLTEERMRELLADLGL
jgi:peroxiredoxin